VMKFQAKYARTDVFHSLHQLPISHQVSAHQLLLAVTILANRKKEPERTCSLLLPHSLCGVSQWSFIGHMSCLVYTWFNHSFRLSNFDLRAEWACIIHFFMPQLARLCPKAKFQGLPLFCVFGGGWQWHGMAVSRFFSLTAILAHDAMETSHVKFHPFNLKLQIYSIYCLGRGCHQNFERRWRQCASHCSSSWR
jgi:hypothetical protein